MAIGHGNKMATRENRERWLRSGVTCETLLEATSGVLVDAEAYYRVLADAIDRAERSILISGWQIDSRVRLRREPGEDPTQHTLRAILRRALERSPTLEIRVLAWNYSGVYLLDREWWTADRLEALAKGRVTVLFDDRHPPSASQHEKIVILDGHTAFVGGIDICDDRWDRRNHDPIDAERVNVHGKPHKAYHDVQAVVRGKAAEYLGAHFAERWASAGGDTFEITPLPATGEVACTVAIPAREVAIARTVGAMLSPPQPPLRHIRQLYVDAIDRAERLVYIETQYISASALLQAFSRRMKDPRRSKLEIALMLPRKPEGMLERLALGSKQSCALKALAHIAQEHGHHFGAYCPATTPSTQVSTDPDVAPTTYVHSKMMIVDDRLLTIGSANATNRSFGLDTEINLAWDAEDDPAVEDAIARLRCSLLEEHAGVLVFERAHEGFVARLDRLTRDPKSRLIAHGYEDMSSSVTVVDELCAEIGDPDRAALAESLFEVEAGSTKGPLTKLLESLGVKTGEAAA